MNDTVALSLIVLTVAPLAVALLSFWIWMLVDCLRNETEDPRERLVWVIVIVLLKLVGAAVYYFVRYRSRPPRAVASAA